DIELFEEYAKGYLEELGDDIEKKEIELLSMSAKIMTLECGVRFLTDYLDGDTYFKIHRENHNLDRARTQFKLVWDMEQKMERMQEIVSKFINK
ncbi:MAG: mucin desulfatase, partial [Clostridia bacterium]|nr:mucin desulfatase [Clostridia bacterium]